MTFYDCLSDRTIDCSPETLSEMCQQINKYLLSIGQVTINNVYSLLGIPPIASGDSIGWELSDFGIGFDRISVTIRNPDPRQFIGRIYFDPEPHRLLPWGNVSLPRRNGKTLCAEAIKHIFAEYGLKNRKENNMTSKSDIPCILIGKKGDPRGVHTVELKIKKVIFNNPATIVFWSDDTKTVVKAGPNDAFDPEKGLAMAISKKVLGNNYKAYGRFKKWLPKEYKEPKLSDGGLEGPTKAFDNLKKTAKEAFEIATS